ncbi:uncharacterized protein LOC105699869 isoform X1 [Orussus abietinus]|uniref:uncharacterized protein LOC105699869 isoform X1 n=1 Tax=Orussus abietinus TaxID=222816 RepID=UPI000625914F|nr:uncharacterized protein LOC105699869 isoform X1 [Orussus abietinus]
MDLKAVVISGEAPESDDESVNIATGIGFPALRGPNSCGTIITGEAPESDDDGTSLSSVSGAVEATACPPYTEIKPRKSKKNYIKYNSLLHKKLHECNEALDRNVLELSEGTFAAGIQQLAAVNRQLLRSELTLQEAACQLRNASNRSRDVSNALIQLADTDFLHSIKI